MYARKFLGFFGALHDGLTDLGVQGAKLGVVLILVLYLWEVYSRYFVGVSTWWSNEYVPYVMCAVTFLMVPAITRSRGHVAMSMLNAIIPTRFAWHHQVVILGISLAICALFTWISVNENLRQVMQDVGLLRVTLTPKIYVSMWITYGFASSALYFLRMLLSVDETAILPVEEVETL